MDNVEKDKEVYKAVIRSQDGCNGNIAKVIHLLFKDKLICKVLGKQIIWYEKTNNNEYLIINHLQVRKMIFERTLRAYNQTAEFLYRNAFNDDYDLHKEHYLTIANSIVKTSKQLCVRASKNNILKEVTDLFL